MKQPEKIPDQADEAPENNTRSHPMKSNLTMLALFDVLGFESRLNRMGLDGLSVAYDALIKVVQTMNGMMVIRPVPNDEGSFHPAIGFLRTGQTYFSDTIILWSDYDDFRLPAFCKMCCALMCESVRVGLPVRGALSVGEAIMDSSSGVFLGMPLVEAARMEAAQRWLGVSFGHSFSREPYNRQFDARLVMPYSQHFKDEQVRQTPHLVLDWPRHWRQEKFGDLPAAISTLDIEPPFHDYYANTLAFVTHSEQQHDWFKHHQTQPSTPTTA